MTKTIPYWSTIPGYCNFGALYREAVRAAPPRASLVEAGVFLGRSLCLLMEAAAAADKELKVYGIDQFVIDGYMQTIRMPWGGTGADWLAAHGPDVLYNQAQSYINACPAKHCLSDILRASTTEAAKHFADESLFFFFLDANHTFNNVLSDLRLWRPKMQPGGMLAGHDLNGKGYNRGVNQALDVFVGETGLAYHSWGKNSWLIHIPK